MLTILGPIVNMIRDMYNHFMCPKIITLIFDSKIHVSSNNYEAKDMGHDLDSLVTLHQLKCFMSFEKWVRRGKVSK